MNENIGSRSPDEPLAKHQKLKANISSKGTSAENHSPYLSKWETTLLKRELAACHTRLSGTEAAANHLRKMRDEVERAFVEREAMLVMQARVERDTIENLKDRLQAVQKNALEINEETIKTDITSTGCEIRAKIESLFTEDPRLSGHLLFFKSEDIASPPVSQDDEVKDQKVREESSLSENSSLNNCTLNSKSEGIPHGELLNRGEAQGPRSDQHLEPDGINKLLQEEERTLLMARTNVLEEQLQSARNMISSLCQSAKGEIQVKETVPIMQKESKGIQEVKQSLLPRKCEDTRSGLHQENTRGNGVPPIASTLVTSRPQGEVTAMEPGKHTCQVHHQQKVHQTSPEVSGSSQVNGDLTRKNPEEFDSQREPEVKVESLSNPSDIKKKKLLTPGDDASPLPEESQNNQIPTDTEQICKLNVGDYHVLVSSSKFFTMDWKKFYYKTIKNKYSCKKCQAVRDDQLMIEDHVWIMHCGGTFQCPLCPGSTQFFFGRNTIRTHIRQIHSDTNPSEN